MSARFDVNALKVATPCPARWEDMAGDERTRFCQHCQKHVYNFSAMTTMEVEQLVLKNEGNVCGRMYRRKDGTVLTADCPTGVAVVKRKRFQWVAEAVAGMLLCGALLLCHSRGPEKSSEPSFLFLKAFEKWDEFKVWAGITPPTVPNVSTMVLLGEMTLPVNPNPTGNGIPPSPPPVGPVNGAMGP